MNNIYEKAANIIRSHSQHTNIIDAFSKIIVFLSQNPESANYTQGETPDADAYIRRMAVQFVRSRSPRPPSMPNTIPDSMVSIILESFYHVPSNKVTEAVGMHMKAMGAENIIGYLLEAYIAAKLETNGWAWCSAPFVKSIDFIKPDDNFTYWELLQIKNRDNSENSSSAAIRNRTQIKKWFRTFSQTGQTNWATFPAPSVRHLLSEQLFQSFVQHYLQQFKS